MFLCVYLYFKKMKTIFSVAKKWGSRTWGRSVSCLICPADPDVFIHVFIHVFLMRTHTTNDLSVIFRPSVHLSIRPHPGGEGFSHLWCDSVACRGVGAVDVKQPVIFPSECQHVKQKHHGHAAGGDEADGNLDLCAGLQGQRRSRLGRPVSQRWGIGETNSSTTAQLQNRSLTNSSLLTLRHYPPPHRRHQGVRRRGVCGPPALRLLPWIHPLLVPVGETAACLFFLQTYPRSFAPLLFHPPTVRSESLGQVCRFEGGGLPGRGQVQMLRDHPGAESDSSDETRRC